MTEPVLNGRVAIVTGGGFNIGRGISLGFARAGAKVVVAGRREELLEQTVARITAEGGEALAVPTDATKTEDCENLVHLAEARFGPVDVLAAIAGGGGGFEPIDQIDPARFEQVVAQNLFATFQMIRVVLPSFRSRNQGSILTCTGAGAFFPMVGWHATAYACAKAAICRLTDQLTAELWETGIRVNAIEPGQVWNETELAAIEAEEQRTGVPHPGRALNHSPEQAAELALFLVSAASHPLRGRMVSVDDRWWRDPALVSQVDQSVHLYRVHRHYLP